MDVVSTSNLIPHFPGGQITVLPIPTHVPPSPDPAVSRQWIPGMNLVLALLLGFALGALAHAFLSKPHTLPSWQRNLRSPESRSANGPPTASQPRCPALNGEIEIRQCTDDEPLQLLME